MDSNSSKDDQGRGIEDLIEEDPQSKHGDQGEAVHGGAQAGPNSDRGGQPIEPQMGNPRAKDRRPN